MNRHRPLHVENCAENSCQTKAMQNGLKTSLGPTKIYGVIRP
jgi:hypothetical protein